MALPAISSAHAVLVSSTPTDGQVLSAAPPSITLVFTESVDPAVTVIDLVDAWGMRFHPLSVHLTHGTDIIADLPRLPDQTYRVTWRTVAADDRHSTSGVVVFGVGARPAVSQSVPADPTPAAGEVLLRWTLLVSLGGLIGGLLLSRTRNRRRDSRIPCLDVDVRSAILGIALISGAIAAVAAPAFAIMQAGGLASAARLLGSQFGQSAIACSAGVLALLVVAWRQRRNGPTCLLDGLAIIGSLVVAVSSALLGHAATSPARTALESVHLLAAMTWFGALLMIAVFAVGLSRRREGKFSDGRRELARLLLPFGRVAIASVACLIMSGVLLIGDSASTIDALLTSTFGRILMLKLGLAVVGGLFGWRAHRKLRSTTTTVSMRSVCAEVLVLTAVVGCGAALASASPPQGMRWRPGVTFAGSPAASSEVGGLLEALTVRPNRPGRNFVSVTVFNSRRPAPAPISAVEVALSGPNSTPGETSAKRLTSGEWVVPTDMIRQPGDWTITIRVERPGLPSVSTDYSWKVAGSSGGPARSVVSQAPVAPIAGTVTTGLAAVLLLWLLTAQLVRRQRRRRVVAARALLATQTSIETGELATTSP
jgi:copper transport protein